MKRYPAYKNSGLTWLGEIPEHWKVLPNIACFKERIERGFISDQLLSVTIDRGIIKQVDLETKKDSSNEDKSHYKKVKNGDLAYNKMRMWQGSVGFSAFEGIVSPAYIVLNPDYMVNAKFFHYLFRTPVYMNESYRNSYGICDDQLSLRYKEFKRMYSIFPPPEEQDAIVSYLEHKLEEIDRFIGNKQKLIALLKEQKIALINRAVTCGINPNVKLKPSGIDWLGDIPEHWDVKKIKNIAFFKGGGTPSKSNLNYWEGNIPWVSPKDMKTLLITDTQDHINQEAIACSACSLIPEDSLLMVVRSGILIHSIPCAVNIVPVTLNQDMKAIIPGKLILSIYLAYFISSKQSELLALWRKTGATVESIEHEFFAPTPVPIPPKDEQERIVSFIQRQTSKIDIAISKAAREIELIKEYRTTLISDVVTGKVDVRDYAKRSDYDKPDRYQ